MIPPDVRVCTPSDVAVLRDRWPAPPGVVDSHVAEQAAGGATFLVAWSGTEPVGVAVLRHAVTVGANAIAGLPDAAQLLHLHVRPDRRGLRVGRTLIAAAERQAAGLGRTALALSVDDANPDARRLYARLGYAPTGIRDTYSYDWVDPDGGAHRSTETAETLLRAVGDGPAPVGVRPAR